MWVFEFLLFLLSINYNSAIECICQEDKFTQADYYWRDYLGGIPKDAVDGGYTETGKKTYVGQMASYIHRGLFPVNIIPGILGGTGSIDVKTHEDTYVKILCSVRNTEFEWKSTSADELHLLADYHLIIGGSESKVVTYIGRANYNGQVQIGRIFPKDISVKGLWLYNKDGAQVRTSMERRRFLKLLLVVPVLFVPSSTYLHDLLFRPVIGPIPIETVIATI